MSFIAPLANHWRPVDFLLEGATLGDPIRHIAQTVCLLENRCDDYAEYLRAIVKTRGAEWVAAVDQWNVEECQHGEVLRLLSEAEDPEFSFAPFMASYGQLVDYHPPDGTSVRGSLAAELVARCVVEALASTLYRVLADATEHAESKRVFTALAKDEARHFGMFLRMLGAEVERSGELGTLARCRHAVRRILSLEDGQIMVASSVVGGRADEGVGREAHWYLARLYGMYRWEHLRYASRMLLQTVAIRPTAPRVTSCTATLWALLKLRWIYARAATA